MNVNNAIHAIDAINAILFLVFFHSLGIELSKRIHSACQLAGFLTLNIEVFLWGYREWQMSLCFTTVRMKR